MSPREAADRRRTVRCVRALALATLLPVALVACSAKALAPETGPAPPDLASGSGGEVSVTAEVASVVSPRASTVVAREGSPTEPVLVVHTQATPISVDLPISVAGVIRFFRASDAVGVADQVRLTPYDGKPYIQAREVRTPPR